MRAIERQGNGEHPPIITSGCDSMPPRRLANETATRRLDLVRKKRGRGICTPRPFRRQVRDGAPCRLDRVAWWAVRDSNPHSSRNQILSLARLPIPPTAHESRKEAPFEPSLSRTTPAK